MRPSITGGLANRVEDVTERADFNSKGAFVKYAVRRELERQEEILGD